MGRTFTAALQRHVVAAVEEGRVLCPKSEHAVDEMQLDMSVVAGGEQLLGDLSESLRLGGAALQFGQCRAAAIVVHGPAVVGVHEIEAPQFRPLIEVRHAGTGELEQRLGQRVQAAEEHDRPHELREIRQERVLGIVRQQRDTKSRTAAS